MSEVQASYTVVDPGDETPPKALDRLEWAGVSPRLGSTTAGATCVGMAPTEAEKDAAIREFADACKARDDRYALPWTSVPDELHYAERQALRDAIHAAGNQLKALAARLPGGR